MGGIISIINTAALTQAVGRNDVMAVRRGLRIMVRRNVIYTILYSVIVVLTIVPYIENNLSDMPTQLIVYNALLFAVVVLLALDVATISSLLMSGTVSAATAAIASNAATVVVYGAKSVWMIMDAVADQLFGWGIWVYLGIAALILTAKTISVVVLIEIRKKPQRGELNLSGTLVADPLLAGAAVATPAVATVPVGGSPPVLVGVPVVLQSDVDPGY